MIDIGANLTESRLTRDLKAVIDRARQANVEAIVCTGTSERDSKLATSIAKKNPGYVFATAGVHPHVADDVSAEWVNNIRTLALGSHVVAIGETGLDFYRDFSPRETQVKVFDKQITLAQELQLPLFVHDRDSGGETLNMLSSVDDIPVVIHCFTGNQEILDEYLHKGFYLGITGWLCDERRGLGLAQMVNRIPLDRLLIETDSPYLLPRNMPRSTRRRINEPENLIWIVNKLAECYGCSVDTIAANTTRNARRFFSLPV